MRQVQQGFGEELRRRRIAAGLSLRDLSATVHYSRGHLSKVETGQACASPELGRLCDAVLNTGGALVALARLSGLNDALTVPALSAIPPRPDFPLRGVVGIDEARAAADGFQDVFVRIRALGQRVRPAFLLPPLLAHAETLSGLAMSASGADKARLLVLAARIAEYAGWMAQEAGDDRCALSLTDQAVEYAAAAGDQVMGVYAQVRRSLISLYRDDGGATILLAGRVQDDPQASARVRGLAALHEAQGHALEGAAVDCHSALDRARDYLDAADADAGQLPLGTSTLADPAAMITGWCLYDLGQPLRAAEILSDEISRIPPSASRSRARYATRCALAYAMAGELEVACQATLALLPEVRDVGSATIRIEFRRLAKVLNRWPAHPDVRELQPAINSVLIS